MPGTQNVRLLSIFPFEQSMAARVQLIPRLPFHRSERAAGCELTRRCHCLLLCVRSYLGPPSASPSAPSSPAARPPAPSVSRPSLSPDPVCLSGIAWRPLRPAFSHTSRTGCRLREGARKESRGQGSNVQRLWEDGGGATRCNISACRSVTRPAQKPEPTQIFFSH